LLDADAGRLTPSGESPGGEWGDFEISPLPQRNITGIRVFGSQPAILFAASGAGLREL
jgi:hypothetical protein